jgi:hypothetical protein
LSWQDKQPVPHTTVTFYSNSENVRRLRPQLWHHDKAPSHTYFFTRDFLPKKKQHDLRPSPTLFHRLKINLEERNFGTINVIETESQAVLNTVTEKDFLDAFKNGRSAGNGAYVQNEATSRVMVDSMPKVSF